MARTTPGVTRQRIVEEAARLFARDGYDATSIANIQEACGLAPGSGALYKHFPSKQDLLAAVVRHHLDRIDEGKRLVAPALDGDPLVALELIARAVLAAMAEQRDALRIAFRELDAFPDLRELAWQGVVAGLYGTVAEWIRHHVEHGRMRAVDADATAAVLLASLTYYRILDATLGHTPGDVDADRYLAAWLDHARLTLGL